MKDFTLKAYEEYLKSIQGNDFRFVTFSEMMQENIRSGKICLIRHDVDRKPDNALQMAQLEHSMGIKASYYFRTKKTTFKKSVIRAIHELGHEVGYHYECLSDSKGNMAEAHEEFGIQLARMRDIVPVSTISMHGRPLRPFDNRDMWKDPQHHSLLINKFGLLGEVYLDVDYSDIAYINDTGRNWLSNVSNRRDKVDSNIPADHENGSELLNYLNTAPHSRIVFQIHPERWTDDRLEWWQQKIKDRSINFVKLLISMKGK